MPMSRAVKSTVVSAIALALATCMTSCARGHKVISIQQDPGKGGNGVAQQPAPYTPPVEVAERMAGAPAGTLSAPAMFASKLYGVNFKYRVYVPAQYHKGDVAALMVFQDATSVYLGLMNTPVVFDNLIHKGEMPMTIALFLDPGTASGEYVQAQDRGKRSDQYDTVSDKYGRFLIEEIIPQVIQKQYNVVKNPAGWAIAGQSSGGIAAFTVGWYWPDYFNKVLTQNGSFVNIKGGAAYPQLIRDEPVKPLRVYLLSGTNDLNNEFGSWLKASTDMASALAERDYDYRFRPGTGAHFPPLQAQADFPNALRWLWRGYMVGTKGKR
ncbi:MAG: alpha/beta hydrolase-fold protein [Gemmatimonadaceae bacterium]